MSKYSLQCGENRTRQRLALEEEKGNDGVHMACAD